MKIVKMIAAVILLAGTLFAQSPIQDVSVGSPLSLSGTSANVLGTNTASKDILAYVLVFQTATNPNKFTFRHDHYFKPTVLVAGTTDTVIELPSVSHLDLSAPVKARVTYVQFVDGSTWGDAASGAPILLDRAELSQLLSRATDAYTKKGEAGFLQLMNDTKQDPQQLPVTRNMAGHMLSLQSQGGMAEVLVELNGRLSAAANHDKTLKP
jgi:hypothetical protein